MEVNKNNATGSIILIALVLVYITSLFYGVIVFRQFSAIEVISVSLLFLMIPILLALLFYREKLIKDKLELSPYTFVIGVLFSAVFLAYAMGGVRWFIQYYPVYPLVQADLGLKVARDSFYHMSLIQSILNFGYPSIAQHDVPIIGYHVLSHYVDALILKVTGLNVFDSYGLLFYFKIVTFASSVAFLVFSVTSKQPAYIFLTCYLVISMFLGGSWHVVGSHGLWFTSLLIVFSFPKVYRILEKPQIATNELIFILFLMVFISLGKVSSGFMYAVFVGFFLIIKSRRDFRIYLLGMAWCVFFYTYMQLMSDYTQGSMQLVSISSLVDALKDDRMLNKAILPVSLFLILGGIFRYKIAIQYFISGLFSLAVLVLVTNVLSNFSRSDVYYFVYGYNVVLVLFLFFLSTKIIFRNNMFVTIVNNLYLKYFILLLLGWVLLGMFKGVVYSEPYLFYKKINEGLVREDAIKNKLTIFNLYNDEPRILNIKEETSIKKFRVKFSDYLEANNLNKKNSLLFCSEEIYEKELNKFNIKEYARGSFLYAVGGVPLIYGVKSLRRTYGYSDYNEESLWKERREFNKSEACKFGKDIVVLKQWENPSFSLVKCD